MRQLIFDFAPDAPPSLENFVAGDNEELLAALRAHVAPDAPPPCGRYLWGAPASGRTHLLRACATLAAEHGRTGLYLSAHDVGDALPDTPNAVLAIDDIEQLAPAAQIALFDAYNRARENGQRLVLAGNAPPVSLPLREDLRTRVGQCVVFALRPLDDTSRARLLVQLAHDRGFALEEAHVHTILRYGARDVPSLVALVAALDEASLAAGRAVTLPMVRAALAVRQGSRSHFANHSLKKE